MVDIRAFHGILYNEEKYRDIAHLVSPPYDVISPSERERLHNLDPHNVVHLILGRELPGDGPADNRFLRAGKYFSDWMRQGVLVEDPREAIYLYRQHYSVEGRERVRRGFIALLRLEELSSGWIMPHETTFPKPKADLLALRRACPAHLSQVMSLYSDPGGEIEATLLSAEKEPPLWDFVDNEEVRHVFWSVSEPALVQRVAALMKNKKAVIADGHHRYETALAIRDEVRRERGEAAAQPYNYAIMYFSRMESEGSAIFPTHRLLKLPANQMDTLFSRLQDDFHVNDHGQATPEALPMFLSTLAKRRQSFGVYSRQGNLQVITLKDERLLEKTGSPDLPLVWKRLEVSVLHTGVFEKALGLRIEEMEREGAVAYTRSAPEALERVSRGEFDAAFFLNPTPMEEIRQVTTAGLRMPQKSTYFYPKLLTGLVIQKLS